jgi:hypothetical protein
MYACACNIMPRQLTQIKNVFCVILITYTNLSCEKICIIYVKISMYLSAGQTKIKSWWELAVMYCYITESRRHWWVSQLSWRSFHLTCWITDKLVPFDCACTRLELLSIVVLTLSSLPPFLCHGCRFQTIFLKKKTSERGKGMIIHQELSVRKSADQINVSEYSCP